MRALVTARDIPFGGELVVSAGTIITPEARDVARARGVAIREVAPEQVPVHTTPETTVALGSDHGGFVMKEALKPLLEELGFTIHDVGVKEEKPADYPDIALAVAELVASGRATRGIIVDGAGIGSAMAANKVPGIRAALCYDRASARNSREHNHANVLTLGGRLQTGSQAEEVVRTWLATPYGGGRHQARIDKISAIEKRYSK
ncbi:MAG: ribose 5-phosphate isomerase B [Bryobacteraceae bacterium]|nr:ribose 5-phosphate isomerase B [Bryobacteraceae bacterium]